jgi:hypothetical protein
VRHSSRSTFTSWSNKTPVFDRGFSSPASAPSGLTRRSLRDILRLLSPLRDNTPGKSDERSEDRSQNNLTYVILAFHLVPSAWFVLAVHQ